MAVVKDDEYYRDDEKWKEVASVLGLNPEEIISDSINLFSEDGGWGLTWTGRRELDNEEAGKVLSIMMGYEVKVVAAHPNETDSENFNVSWPRSGEPS